MVTLAIFVQLLLHDADRTGTVLKVETSQVQNMQNITEMNQFISSLNSSSLPTDFGKSNVISKLNSITKTQNLISDYEKLKYDYEMLKQNFNIVKNQNDMLIKENNNLDGNSKNYFAEIENLRAQLKVI